MKKLYLSSLLFIIIQFFFLLYPTTQYAASPGNRSFADFKTMSLSRAENTTEFERHRLWLNLTSKEGIFKQLLIGYITGATNSWDSEFDALTMDAYQFADFYSINDNKKLVIQGRAVPFEVSDIVTLGYRSAIIGDLTIAIDHADGDLESRDIYLVDKETGIVHNLKNGGYTFYTKIGNFTNRFEIRYTANQNLGTNKPVIVNQRFTVASRNQIISLKSDDDSLKEVSVFDITGKLLYSSQKIGRPDLEITGIQANAQILLVKTTLENGNIISKKIFF